MINDDIKIFAKISAKSFMKWLAVIGMGLLSSLICLIISIFLMRNNEGGGFAGAGVGGVGALLGIFVLFRVEFWTTLLFFSSFLFAILYVAVANKIALMDMLCSVWESKSTDFIFPMVSHYLQKICNKHTDWLKGKFNHSELVMVLIDMCKHDNISSKIKRKILYYGLKKIHLEDVNLQDENIDLTSVITKKIIQSISETTKPSWKLLWGVAGIQSVLLILALVFDHH